MKRWTDAQRRWMEYADRVSIATSPDPSEVQFAERDKVQERTPYANRGIPPLRHPYGNEIDPRSLPETPKRTR